MDHDAPRNPRDPARFWRSRYAVGLLVLGAIAAWLLLSEHRIHALGALPYLVLLACPLMHLFMHRGHGAHGHGAHGGGEHAPGDPASPARREPGDAP